jgi:hypothetical protein
MKKLRTSYSQHNTYIKCPEHWHKSYVERYKSPIEGASMYFGTAVDTAVETMLMKTGDPYQVFEDYWRRSFNFGKATQVFDNDNITYGYKDFDKDVLTPQDTTQMGIWAQTLGLSKTVLKGDKSIELFDKIVKKKKNPYKNPSKDEMKYFNRSSWLSMKRKGDILLKSFEEQFLPKVKNVIAVQKRADIVDPATGDSVVGYIDMILEIEGYDKPIIFDLKTASRPYSQEQLDFSEQLTLYCAMKGQYALDRSDFVDTDLVGYVVLCKEINKDKEAHCKTCGHLRSGRHRTCDAMYTDPNDKTKQTRCGGEWEETVALAPHVQVMVARKTQDQVDILLQDIAAIIAGMKNGIIYKNTSNCTNWYGNKCPFFDACHKNDYSKLIKK